MSRYKFRAWSDYYKMMDEDESFEIFSKYPPDKIMQWTGLKDKNGVDIYEGDIDSEGLTFTYNVDMGGWYRMKDGKGVQWHCQCLRQGRLPFEIVGNIHEGIKDE